MTRLKPKVHDCCNHQFIPVVDNGVAEGVQFILVKEEIDCDRDTSEDISAEGLYEFLNENVPYYYFKDLQDRMKGESF